MEVDRDTRLMVEMGPAIFERLSEERQFQILGPAKYGAYKAGAIKLGDVAGFRKDPKWGPVGFERSLKDIMGERDGKEYSAARATGIGDRRGMMRAGEGQGGQPGRGRKRIHPITPARPASQQLVSTMARRVAATLEDIVGTMNRWSGDIYLSRYVTGGGRKDWSCDIMILDDVEMLGNADRLWATIVHEMLHGLSVGNNPRDYDRLRGWEEGVVEQLQSVLGPRVMGTIGERPYQTSATYPLYTGALERLRDLINQPPDEFYLALIRTPLPDRPRMMVSLGDSLDAERKRGWRAELRFQSMILGREVVP